MKSYLLSIILSLMLCASCVQSSVTVPSPDGNLDIAVSQSEGQLCFSVHYKGTALVEDAPVGIEFADVFFGKNLDIACGNVTRVVDDYDMPTGKASHIHSESSSCVVELKDESGRTVEMHLRAFDDAVAYRWFIPEQENMKDLAIRREKMELNTVGDPVLKAMILPGFTSSHEAVYATQPLSGYEDSLLIDMPVYLSFPGGQFMAVTEAMVVDFAGMMLTTEGGRLHGVLSPRPDDSGLSVTGDLPRRSPWRVFEVTDRDGSLLESTVLTTLADPCTEQNLSWLNPGISTWPWWNGYQCPEELKKGDFNTVNQNLSRYYIDFCAENGIPYHSITGILDERGEEVCWYYNEGSRPGSPGENDDTRRLYPGYDFGSVCSYAGEKGVGIRVWVHWKTFGDHMEESFRQFQKWGVRGMMVDFMDRDDEDMIAYQEKVLQMAMKYRMHIQFHGASKPSGLQRTYPSEFTREGTYNYETYKWDAGYRDRICGADHDLDMPFTRCLAGPTDYHLGSFRAVRADDFEPKSLRPVTTSTRSHSLAMYIVLESTLQLACDTPDSYRGEVGFDFLKSVPTVWDETRVLDAKMDEYIIVARRKGCDWYIGCIGNEEPRDLNVSMDFLGDGGYEAVLYHDTAGSDENPNSIGTDSLMLSGADVLDVHIAACGGFAAHIRPCSDRMAS